MMPVREAEEMVGREEGSGDHGQDVPSVRCIPKGSGVFEARTRIPDSGNQALEQRAWAIEDRACCRVAAETFTAYQLHDPQPGGIFPFSCEKNAASCSFLHSGLVHWIAALRNRGPQVVDGQS